MSITKLNWNESDGTIADVNDIKPIADKVDTVIDQVNTNTTDIASNDSDIAEIQNSLSTGYQYMKGEFVPGTSTAQKWEMWEYNNKYWISQENNNTETPATTSTKWKIWSNFSHPTGSIIMYAASTAPAGYLECDGSAISRTTYADLFAVIGTTFGSGDGSTTFNIPDLRGEFVRGWDNGRGVDSGRAFGSSQSDALKSHRHQIDVSTGGTTGAGKVTGNTDSDNVAYTNYTGDTETRPRNIALMYIIKY